MSRCDRYAVACSRPLGAADRAKAWPRGRAKMNEKEEEKKRGGKKQEMSRLMTYRPSAPPRRVINNVSRDGPIPWRAGPFISYASHVNAPITARCGAARRGATRRGAERSGRGRGRDARVDRLPERHADRRIRPSAVARCDFAWSFSARSFGAAIAGTQTRLAVAPRR